MRWLSRTAAALALLLATSSAQAGKLTSSSWTAAYAWNASLTLDSRYVALVATLPAAASSSILEVNVSISSVANTLIVYLMVNGHLINTTTVEYPYESKQTCNGYCTVSAYWLVDLDNLEAAYPESVVGQRCNVQIVTWDAANVANHNPATGNLAVHMEPK
ncbi:MAG: hypothetical protein ACRDZ4_10885 [Egibacteraceae bacterium]